MKTSKLYFFLWAAYSGDIFSLKKYLDDGIDIHSCHDLALRLAVKSNQLKSIIFLLTNGANINAIYDDALCQFSLEGDVHLVESLLNHNTCSEKAKNFALLNAISNKHENIINLLQQNGVSLFEDFPK